MNLQDDLLPAVAGFFGCTLFTLWWTFRSSNPSVGLFLGYWLHFLQNYGAAGIIHALPWVDSRVAEETAVGFPEAVFSLVLFCFGAAASHLLMKRRQPPVEVSTSGWAGSWATPRQIFFMGILMGYIFGPLISRIPSGGAVSSTLASLTAAAWGILAYRAVVKREYAKVALLTAGLVFFPLSTMIQSGFIGFGVNSVILVVSLMAVYFRPRMGVLAAGLLVLFLGLSIYITYMRDRNEIRHAVWGGESIKVRATVLVNTFSNMEWLDLRSEIQILYVDARMNQNVLVGVAIDRLQRGEVGYWHGKSILEAILSVIPRLFWPNKPMTAGSGDLVSEVTGMTFTQGTSVGIGPILEFYANFGHWGLGIASLLMGGFLGMCDIRAGACLRAGHTTRFAAWLLLALPLHNVLGSLVSIFTSIATAGVLFFLFQRFWEPRRVVLSSGFQPVVGEASQSMAAVEKSTTPPLS